ncbi:hypothetical protein YC2023_118351 [Brassica napus]
MNLHNYSLFIFFIKRRKISRKYLLSMLLFGNQLSTLLRFRDSKNIKNHSEFMGLTLILLDEKRQVKHLF